MFQFNKAIKSNKPLKTTSFNNEFTKSQTIIKNMPYLLAMSSSTTENSPPQKMILENDHSKGQNGAVTPGVLSNAHSGKKCQFYQGFSVQT